jgi:crossover junction endodeoxyribonuclease RuvC
MFNLQLRNTHRRTGNALAERIILGIDPGTNITGYGLIACQGKRMRLLSCGVIQLGRQQSDHPDKLKRIFRRVSSLIDSWKPVEVALEAPFYGKNVQSMLKLGRAQGVAMAAALAHDLPIFEYAPLKVKQAVTGNGRASKQQVAAMLEQVLDFRFEAKYYDASDGLAVAVCHFYQGMPATGKSKSKDWAAFIRDNPDRIKGD